MLREMGYSLRRLSTHKWIVGTLCIHHDGEATIIRLMLNAKNLANWLSGQTSSITTTDCPILWLPFVFGPERATTHRRRFMAVHCQVKLFSKITLPDKLSL